MRTNDQDFSDHSMQPNDSMALGQLSAGYRAAAKVQTVDHEDPKVRDRIKHVLLKGEKVLQFFARTGLSKSQCLQLSHGQIEDFVKRVTANAKNEPSPLLSVWESAPLGKKFRIAIDTFAEHF